MCVNGDAESTYKESYDFTAFDGCKLLEPESGSAYDIEVEAGQTRIVTIRQACGGYSLGMSYSS
jgi:hypothetical protein